MIFCKKEIIIKKLIMWYDIANKLINIRHNILQSLEKDIKKWFKSIFYFKGYTAQEIKIKAKKRLFIKKIIDNNP